MKIKIPCAFVYTSEPLSYLKDCGFNIVIEDFPDKGFNQAFIPLNDSNHQPTGLMIFEVLDEVSFLAHYLPDKKQREQFQFNPYLSEENISPISNPVKHPNTVTHLIRTIEFENLRDEPWKDFLSIRKRSQLLAVILGCQDYKKAAAFGSFQKEFVYEERKYGLIHLGPSCFDILITQN